MLARIFYILYNSVGATNLFTSACGGGLFSPLHVGEGGRVGRCVCIEFACGAEI